MNDGRGWTIAVCPDCDRVKGDNWRCEWHMCIAPELRTTDPRTNWEWIEVAPVNAGNDQRKEVAR